MFIICSEVKVQKHEHHHYYGRGRMSKNSSLNSIVLESKHQVSPKKQKIRITTSKKNNNFRCSNNEQQQKRKQKMKNSTKEIKDKCLKGLSKTKTTNTNSINNLASLNMDFTRKIDSWQMNMNTQGTELNNQIRQEEEVSNRVSKQSEGSNNDTLITFKNPSSLHEKIKHNRLSSYKVNTVISQSCMDQMQQKQYVIQQSLIFDHSLTNKFN